MGNGPDDRLTLRDHAENAWEHGYEGQECGSCGNFTLVRNGNMLKCDTCGEVTEESEDGEQTPVIIRFPGEHDKN